MKSVAQITGGLSIGLLLAAAKCYAVGGVSWGFAFDAFAAALLGGFSVAWHLVVRGLGQKGGE